VHPIDLTGLRRPGRYRIVVGGPVDAASPPFRVASRRALFGGLADDTVRFFQAQRDGAHVPDLLDRKPSHLTDRHATVYDTPVFTGDGGDVPAAPLHPIGGPVDVEGGWFDAGDFVKFTHCPQHQVANLAGSLTGGREVLVGAVVNGPNGAENFEDIGIPDGARACPVDGRNRFAAFDRADARFLDDVRAWPSVEPAIDFTSTGMLAFALAAAG
jgi:hypothetical protein